MTRPERHRLHDHSDDNSGGRLAAQHISGLPSSSTTIVASGGAAVLNDLGDVDLVTTPPADNDSLTYDSATGQWVPEAVSGGSSFATPAIVLGTAAAAGAASTVIRSDATIVAFDATVPVQDGGSASAGSAAVAARRDHKHPGDKVGIVFVIDGGGATITTGAKGVIKVPFACTITESELESDASSNTTLTIKKRAYGGGAASSIVAAALPTLSAVSENKDSTLTGWTTSVSAGDKLYWEVTTNSAAKTITSTLTATRA